jgi:hypothetical protein
VEVFLPASTRGDGMDLTGKMFFGEVEGGGEDWIDLAQDRDH